MFNQKNPRRRREFLSKSLAFIGLIQLSAVSSFANLLPKPSFRGFRVMHSNGIDALTKVVRVGEFSGQLMDLRFSTHPLRVNEYRSDHLTKSALAGVLFGRTYLKNVSVISAEDLERHNGIWINSNSHISDPRIQNRVKSYRIIESTGGKIGVMGISFEGSQPIADTIAIMNSAAKKLKVEQCCDYVVCLTECPKEAFSYFGLQNLAENSAGIDQFLATSNEYARDRLHVLQNKEKTQVLLSQKNSTSSAVDLLEVNGITGLRFSAHEQDGWSYNFF